MRFWAKPATRLKAVFAAVGVLSLALGLAGLFRSGSDFPRQLAASTSAGLAPLLLDLNHDGRQDTVALSGHSIDIRLEGLGNKSLECIACSGGVVYAVDVNRDSHLDLVRVSDDLRQAPMVWLGDGAGNFALRAAHTPSATDFASLPAAPAPSWPTQSGHISAAEKAQRRQRLPRRAHSHVRVPRPAPVRVAVNLRIPHLSAADVWMARTVNLPPPASPLC